MRATAADSTTAPAELRCWQAAPAFTTIMPSLTTWSLVRHQPVGGRTGGASAGVGAGSAVGVEEEAVEVHNLVAGSTHVVHVKRSDKVKALRAAVADASGVDVAGIVLVANGGALEDHTALSKVLQQPGVVVGMCVSLKVDLVFNPARKAECVELSADRKSMFSNHPDYCYQESTAVVTDPFPLSGTHRWALTITKDVGCYDSFGLATAEFDPTEATLGRTASSWAIQTCYHRIMHDGSRERMDELSFTSGEKLLLEFKPAAGTLNVTKGDGTVLEVLKDLPRVPLYFAANVCGHEGENVWTISDAD